MSDKRDRIGLRLDTFVLQLAKFVAPLTFIIGLIGIFAACVVLMHKRHRTKTSFFWAAWTIGLVALFMGSSAALTLAVSWQYSEKPAATYGYYTCAIVPLIQIAEILGFLMLISLFFDTERRKISTLFMPNPHPECP